MSVIIENKDDIAKIMAQVLFDNGKVKEESNGKCGKTGTSNPKVGGRFRK